MTNISTALLDRRRVRDYRERGLRVSMALHLWRRELIECLAAAETEDDIDLYGVEFEECQNLQRAFVKTLDGLEVLHATKYPERPAS
jgi:hypothetical protein